MKKRLILFIGLILLFLNSYVLAATLDELNRPLLDKGQWRLDTETEAYYYDAENRWENFLTQQYEYYDYNYTRYRIKPAVYYGISDSLQFGLSSYYTFPYEFDYDDYDETGIDNYYKTEVSRDHYFSEMLTWRPNQSWEFYLNPSQARNKLRDIMVFLMDMREARTYLTDNIYSVTAGATWLSDPQPGNKSAHNRADLDGLAGPLLDKKQIEASLRLEYEYWNLDLGGDTDKWAGILFTVLTSKGQSHYTLITPSLSYGIHDNLQMDVGMGYRIPGANYYKLAIDQYFEPGWGYYITRIDDRTLNAYYPRLGFIHRPHPQFQWYTQGDFAYRKFRYNVDYFSMGIAPPAVQTDDDIAVQRTITAKVGFSWISKPRKEGETLNSDLDGLKQPLLEAKQIRLDASFTAYRDTSWTSDETSWRREYCDIDTQISYGLKDTLQLYIAATVRPPYRYPIDQGVGSTKYINPLRTTLETGITYRPRRNFEIYAKACATLQDVMEIGLENEALFRGILSDVVNATAYKEENDFAGLEGVTYNKGRDATFILGATFLW